MHAPYRGHRITGAAAAEPGAPLDGFTSPNGAYSFRKLLTAYAGPAMRLRRASDNLEVNINFLGAVGGSAPWDVAVATAHCAATTCWLRTWYDQSGLGRDIGNATAATQLQLNFACADGKPCFQTTAVASQSAFTAGTYTPVTPLSMSTVSNRATYGGGNSECLWFKANATNRMSTFAGPWYLAAAAALAASPQPADAAWHTQQGVINDAASMINIDGTETAGTVAVNTGIGSYLVGSNTATTTTCQWAEVIYWSGYALTPAQRSFLTSNQRAYISP